MAQVMCTENSSNMLCDEFSLVFLLSFQEKENKAFVVEKGSAIDIFNYLTLLRCYIICQCTSMCIFSYWQLFGALVYIFLYFHIFLFLFFFFSFSKLTRIQGLWFLAFYFYMI